MDVSQWAHRKLHQSRPQQTLFNIALSMLFSWVTFLAGFERVDSEVGCLVVAALLHYLILASFLWMLVEGVLQFLLLVKVKKRAMSRYMIKTALPAWGMCLPYGVMVVVVVMVIVVMVVCGDGRDGGVGGSVRCGGIGGNGGDR